MISVMPTVEDHVRAGRSLVGSGDLQQLRHRIGLTRLAMSEMLHMSPLTYTKLEQSAGASDSMWNSTAERLGRFEYLAELTLEELETEGIALDDLTPMHVVATQQGLPQELILKWYREGRLPAYDLGILGLWIGKDDIHYLRGAA
jgi:transcriptional regulator with XRE-family HTH domain